MEKVRLGMDTQEAVNMLSSGQSFPRQGGDIEDSRTRCCRLGVHDKGEEGKNDRRDFETRERRSLTNDQKSVP